MDKEQLNAYMFKLGDTVPKRVHRIALRIYLALSKGGKEIPPPLQDYINRGLQRVLDGDRTPFPTTKEDKYNQAMISIEVRLIAKKKGKEQAIKEVAALCDIDEKTVRNYCRNMKKNNPEYFWYYFIESLNPNDWD
jgi:hypothetical protein